MKKLSIGITGSTGSLGQEILKNKHFKSVIMGEGPLVILVHGWPETWVSWKKQIKFGTMLLGKY